MTLFLLGTLITEKSMRISTKENKVQGAEIVPARRHRVPCQYVHKCASVNVYRYIDLPSFRASTYTSVPPTSLVPP